MNAILVLQMSKVFVVISMNAHLVHIPVIIIWVFVKIQKAHIHARVHQVMKEMV